MRWKYFFTSPNDRLASSALCPLVVVGGEPADPHHRIHRRRTADHLSARPIDFAATQLLLGYGQIIPVDRTAEELGKRDRNADVLVLVGRAGFEHDHMRRRIGTKSIGDNRTRRTSSDDDIICSDICVARWITTQLVSEVFVPAGD